MAARGESSTRLYTRTGDGGETGLTGGRRVAKDSARIRAYGALDELGAFLGLLEVELPDALGGTRATVHRLQHELFLAQAELAVPPNGPTLAHRIEARHVERLERETDALSKRVPPLKSFALERGSRPAALAHVARTIARRAERDLWSLHREEPQRPEILQWSNRLSALLFAVALEANAAVGVAEEAPDYSV